MTRALAFAVALAVTPGCGSCPTSCASSLTGATVGLQPPQFSHTTVSLCVNDVCESAMYQDVSPVADQSWLLALGQCYQVEITNDIDSADAKFVAFIPTSNTTCTWFPLKLGDTLQLSVVASDGTVLFNKSHTVTYQADVCGQPCEKPNTRF